MRDLLRRIISKPLFSRASTTDTLSSLDAPVMSAAADVALPPPAKVSSAPTAVPSFITSARTSQDSFLPKEDLRLANLDISTLRTGTTTPSTLRKLAKASPDLSAALFAVVRLALTSNYLVLSRNLDGTLNPDGTRLAQQLCRRFNLLGPTDGGYNAFPSLRSAGESLARELMMLGGGAVELVLNKARLPEGIQPLTVETVKWKFNGKRKVPYQVVGSEEISLDVPTFFYVSLDQDLQNPYCDSPIQASIQPLIASQDFQNDLRRVARRAVHPRVKVGVIEEMWRKRLPPEVLQDPDALAAAAQTLIATVKTMVDGLNPEDALVLFDTLTVEYLTGGANTIADEWKVLSEIINGKISSGAKSMPVILGHSQVGSQNIASSQTLIFIKTVEGIVQKVNELYSRMLTLAIRLYGVDAVVEFSYDTVDLRPASELEAFKSMRQSRYLELLSLGLIDDAEASLVLTGSLPVPGMPVLAGTRFKTAPAGVVSTPESNTSALNQDVNSDAPKGAKSKNQGSQ